LRRGTTPFVRCIMQAKRLASACTALSQPSRPSRRARSSACSLDSVEAFYLFLILVIYSIATRSILLQVYAILGEELQHIVRGASTIRSLWSLQSDDNKRERWARELRSNRSSRSNDLVSASHCCGRRHHLRTWPWWRIAEDLDEERGPITLLAKRMASTRTRISKRPYSYVRLRVQLEQTERAGYT
jgi:hypothetical protein